MRLFGGTRDNWHKAKAAVIVQNLLEHQVRAGNFQMDPAKSANELVEIAFFKFDHVLDGRFGQRPHPMAFAALALKNAIEVLKEDNSNRQSFVFSLINMILEVQAHEELYPFNSLDKKIFGESRKLLEEESEKYKGVIESGSLDFLFRSAKRE